MRKLCVGCPWANISFLTTWSFPANRFEIFDQTFLPPKVRPTANRMSLNSSPYLDRKYLESHVESHFFKYLGQGSVKKKIFYAESTIQETLFLMVLFSLPARKKNVSARIVGFLVSISNTDGTSKRFQSETKKTQRFLE